MELDKALTEIAEIRRQMERCGSFEGYRSLPVAASGGLAVVVAAVQTHWIPDPVEQLPQYLCLWIGTAVVSAMLASIEIVVRTGRSTAARRQLTLAAIGQLLPCLVAGALVTAVIATGDASQRALLPGLWAVLFSLGIFASTRHLPRSVLWAGMWYLVSGTAVLAWFRGNLALSPWSMILTFGAGQLLAAAILYFELERPHGD